MINELLTFELRQQQNISTEFEFKSVERCDMYRACTYRHFFNKPQQSVMLILHGLGSVL